MGIIQLLCNPDAYDFVGNLSSRFWNNFKYFHNNPSVAGWFGGVFFGRLAAASVNLAFDHHFSMHNVIAHLYVGSDDGYFGDFTRPFSFTFL